MGATARQITGLVIQIGIVQAGTGLAIGLVASLAVNRLLRAELVQVSPGDPLALLGASAALIVSVVLGCVIPARRAARVDPLVARGNPNDPSFSPLDLSLVPNVPEPRISSRRHLLNTMNGYGQLRRLEATAAMRE